jgi:hypothetical protein
VAQIEIFAPDITGELSAVIVEVPSNQPTNVIPSTSTWQIDCTWLLEPPGSIVGGSWRLQAVVEGLGSAVELETAPLVVAIDGRVRPATYNQSIVFPAPQTALLGAQDSVLLKVGVALTYRTLANKPGPLAAFLDLGVLQVFANQP